MRATRGADQRGALSIARTIAAGIAALIAVALLPLGEVMRPVDAAGPYTVTTTGDEPDSAPGDGSCKTSVSTCTLRAAIMEANAFPGSDDVHFSIGGGGVWTIAPLSPLPSVTDDLNILGSTQPGFAGTPLIQLDGSLAGVGATGLFMTTSSTVSGLAIYKFSSSGIVISSPSGGVIVSGNHIGTDGSGTSGLGNLNGVMILNSPGNTIGGSTAAERNVISGNTNGLLVTGSLTSFTTAYGNWIGLHPSGVAALGNDTGVALSTDSDSSLIHDNIIGGNTMGVTIGSNATAAVYNNRIGVDATFAPLPNAFYGILVAGNGANGVQINGNAILYNGGAGVFIDSGSSLVAVFENNIDLNGGLGIDLNGTGVDANDAGDADAGGNGGQNYPVLKSSTTTNFSTTKVSGTLNSTPSTNFTIDVYAGPSCDPSGHGEGWVWLGSTNVMTDGLGVVGFVATVNMPPELDAAITATALGPDGTSEFSACINHDMDGDGCSDVEEGGLNESLGGQRSPLDYFDFYDVNDDQSIELSDTLVVLAHFGHAPAGDAMDNRIDRYVPNPLEPWRTGEGNDGIDLSEALANLKSFGHDCTALP